ncbi:AGE family epimerase/isomerase [Ponticaulis profundi]|uniref:AGE family epimerase/isomerase n=1 Tax=Ponticaulis profundi TaxID=2665222 RepID=A0ABW1SDR3_9PROT
MGTKILPIILCGGSGTRLWPLSRTYAPKQLQSLTNEKSLLANTVLRLQSGPDCLAPVLICGRSYVDEIENQLEHEGAVVSTLITEPKGRDTAAAAAIAAHWGAKFQATHPTDDVILLLLPSDHHISNIAAFHAAIGDAAKAAMCGYISTIGITPHAPETGFGYINRAAEPIAGLASYPVIQFVEKPDKVSAHGYLRSGDYLWNAGMFAFRPNVFLDELLNQSPEIARRAESAFRDADLSERPGRCSRLNLKSTSFLKIPSLSVDYAVMEKTKKACVLPAEFGWNDVGSWAAAHEIAETDEKGNALVGDVIAMDSRNSFIKSHNKLIAAVDVDDLIVVDTQNAILVCPKTSSQKVKNLHAQLSAMNHPSAYHSGVGTRAHRKVVEEKVRSWLFDTALPFWGETGIDRINGGSYEAVDFFGKPLEDLNKRTLVQARQTYVFAHSFVLGHRQSKESMAEPLEFLIRYGQQSPGRFAHKLTPEGQVFDSKFDTYDHAFILFALAWAYQVTGEPSLLKTAEDTMEFILTDLRHPHGGFREDLSSTNGLRRANPHMHLFEAALAWMELHEHERMSELAKELYDLFHTKFWKSGLLREFFLDDLSLPTQTDDPVRLAIEPGHFYEWAYLLNEYEKLTGRTSLAPAVLEAFADRYGHDRTNGLVVDHTKINGEHFTPTSSRLWPQTEFVRLKISHNDPREEAEALSAIETFMSKFFTFNGSMPGYWRDKVSSNGVNLVDRSPASSFYHILGCFEPILK